MGRPYTIVETFGKGFYSLKSIATPISIVKWVNESQLKPFLTSSNQSDTHCMHDESLVQHASTHSKSDNQTLSLSSQPSDPVSSIEVTCATAPTDSGQARTSVYEY